MVGRRLVCAAQAGAREPGMELRLCERHHPRWKNTAHPDDTRCPGSVVDAVRSHPDDRIPFLEFFVVARGLRILQDFGTLLESAEVSC